jgi:hypothetical protein
MIPESRRLSWHSIDELHSFDLTVSTEASDGLSSSLNGKAKKRRAVHFDHWSRDSFPAESAKK